MASLESNKFFAAILTAGVVATGGGVLSSIVFTPDVPEQRAYQIDTSALQPAGGEAPAEEQGVQPIAPLLASADVAQGETVANKCSACHVFDEGGGNGVGPNLHGVVGREIAALGDFSYSQALADKGGAWDYEALNQFLYNPKEYAAGTKMAFAGLSKDQDRADIIAYLRSVTPDAPPLPAPGEGAEQASAAPEGGGVPAEPAQPVAALVAEADVGKGETVANKCAACHSFEEGGEALVGPPLHGIVGRDVASVADFSYSPALSEKQGAWDDEALNQFLEKPTEYAPGTLMSFAGISKEQDRLDLIAYLRSLSPEAPPVPAAEQGGGQGEGAGPAGKQG